MAYLIPIIILLLLYNTQSSSQSSLNNANVKCKEGGGTGGKFISLPVIRKLLAFNRQSNCSMETSAIELFKQGSMHYLTEVSIGTAKNNNNNYQQLQKFTLLIDTGSSAIWVLSANCNDASCAQSKHFDELKSKTFVGSKRIMSYKFGDNLAITGYEARDNLHLNNMLLVRNQTFLNVLHLENGHSSAWKIYDGILGLGFPQLTGAKYPILLETMKQQGLIDKLMFSIFLHHQEELDRFDLRQSSGKLLFGSHIEGEQFSGQLNYIPLSRASFWEIRLEQIKLVAEKEGESEYKQELPNNITTLIDVCTNVGCRAILDTGTYMIMGFSNQVNLLNRALGGRHYSNGLYIIENCSRKMPKLVFIINGFEFKLEPEQYLIPLNRNNEQQSTCLSGIRSSDSESGAAFWILGDIFLANFYTVFDMEEKRIGLASLKNKCCGLDQLSRP